MFVADSSSRSADPVSRRRFCSSDRGDAGALRSSGKIASSSRQIENPRASQRKEISVLWNRYDSSLNERVAMKLVERSIGPWAIRFVTPMERQEWPFTLWKQKILYFANNTR